MHEIAGRTGTQMPVKATPRGWPSRKKASVPLSVSRRTPTLSPCLAPGPGYERPSRHGLPTNGLRAVDSRVVRRDDAKHDAKRVLAQGQALERHGPLLSATPSFRSLYRVRPGKFLAARARAVPSGMTEHLPLGRTRPCGQKVRERERGAGGRELERRASCLGFGYMIARHGQGIGYG
eukprot:603003-Amorphochlora_amoeboformis.AAC.3